MALTRIQRSAWVIILVDGGIIVRLRGVKMLMPHTCTHCTTSLCLLSVWVLERMSTRCTERSGIMLWVATAQELQVELVYKAHAHPAEGFVAREGDDVSRLLRSLADHPSLRAVQARPPC